MSKGFCCRFISSLFCFTIVKAILASTVLHGREPLPGSGGLRATANRHDPQRKIPKCPHSPALSYSVVYMTIIVAEGTLHRNSKRLLCPEALSSQDESRVITLLHRRMAWVQKV